MVAYEYLNGQDTYEYLQNGQFLLLRDPNMSSPTWGSHVWNWTILGGYRVHLRHTFLTMEEAIECIEAEPEYHTAETLEGIEQICVYISISILLLFLIENILFMAAFHLSRLENTLTSGMNHIFRVIMWGLYRKPTGYFKIIYFPLDLFVVLVSLATEILGLVHHRPLVAVDRSLVRKTPDLQTSTEREFVVVSVSGSCG